MISYEILFLSGSKLKSIIEAVNGQKSQQLKKRILDKQKLQNGQQFEFEQTRNLSNEKDRIIMINEVLKRNSRVSQKNNSESIEFIDCQSLERTSRKLKEEEFPECPPMVEGQLRQNWKTFSCFSSIRWASLSVVEFQIRQQSARGKLLGRYELKEVKSVGNYAKKGYYFLRVILENDLTMDFKFYNKAICKEWLGYFEQALTFNEYLEEREHFSRGESFKIYINTLMDYKLTDHKVTLQDTQQSQDFTHSWLSEQKVVKRQKCSIITLNEFNIKGKIGEGSFSEVYLAERQSKLYALKQLEKKHLFETNQLPYAVSELKILSREKLCPYVVPLHFAFQTKDYLYLALEYVSTGDLQQLIASRKKLSPKDALIILAEVVVAIEYIHSFRVIYRDLKPANVLVRSNGHIYLTDFGLAKELEDHEKVAESFVGTLTYLAPQRFNEVHTGVDFKSDIYTVGCLFYEMLHGKSYSNGHNEAAVVYNIKHKDPQIDLDLPSDYISFLKQTLQKNMKKRLTCMSAHEIFKRINLQAVKMQKHQGLLIEQPNSKIIPIQYQIDQDYTQQTFSLNKVKNWIYPRTDY